MQQAGAGEPGWIRNRSSGEEGAPAGDNTRARGLTLHSVLSAKAGSRSTVRVRVRVCESACAGAAVHMGELPCPPGTWACRRDPTVSHYCALPGSSVQSASGHTGLSPITSLVTPEDTAHVWGA